MVLKFEKSAVVARAVAPSGELLEQLVEIRINPVSGRTCRIAFARSGEREAATETLPPPPPSAHLRAACPFCRPQVFAQTPRFASDFVAAGRLIREPSILFPNLFPYGTYSAVSLIDDQHFVEIGTASAAAYGNCLLNCRDFLRRVRQHDVRCRYLAITQNHLPSAGGSLVHPHLQVHADGVAPNHLRVLGQRTRHHFKRTGRRLFCDYLAAEQKEGARIIGRCGDWHWLAAFAPEGFYEIWGILPGVTGLNQISKSHWMDLARGIVNAQRFYRHLNRNGYNLGVAVVDHSASALEVRVVVVARSNYASWVRSDMTGYELMLGDMATFTAPEETARMARRFWQS
jgi:galactose-1-phosphate uridylyltransferase